MPKGDRWVSEDCRRGIHRRCHDCDCGHHLREAGEAAVEVVRDEIRQRRRSISSSGNNDDAFIAGLIVGGITL